MKQLLTAGVFFALVALVFNGSEAPGQVIAHRGVFAVAGQETAENTIDAIKKAYDRGYRKVEIDVRATLDGQGVLMHDNCPNSASTGCFGPGRTTNDDNNGGTYTPLYAKSGGIYSGKNATPQGRTYQQMVSNYKYHKVYDQAGNILRYFTQSGVAHGWSLADLIWYKQNSSDSDAYKVRNMTIVFDIQSPQALAAAQAAVGQYNAWGGVEFKCWTTALPVDNSGNLQGTYYGGFAFSYNPYTLQPASGNTQIASFQVSFPSGPGWVSYAQFNNILSKLRIHASTDTNESFIASDGNWNNQDNLVITLFNNEPYAYQYGVVRNPDIIRNGTNFFVNTDQLNLVNSSVLYSQQSFGNRHAQPITDILR